MLNLHKLNKILFDRLTNSIYRTPPVQCDPGSNVAILSQTFRRDVSMYLVAAKSFAAHIQPREFIVVDDGLHDDDRARISHHLGTVTFLRSMDVDTGCCPRGACWERLISIAIACRTSYVIQLDADTVTTASPDTVARCVRDRRSFTLSTKQGRQFVSLKDASDFARGVNSEHVQIQSERVLERIPDSAAKQYIRGCAGFAGFPQNSLKGREIEAFSKFMEDTLGRATWYQWGSEQVTSNYMIANMNNPLALPLEEYPYWAPDTNLTSAQLIHFIGEHRFASTKYLQVARQAIAKLTP